MRQWLLCLTLIWYNISFGQVNLQTGAAQAFFPLFEHSDSKNRLGTSISLQYIYGNGLKVNEPASNVGTGWLLQAGGFISRIQHGEPDDQRMATLPSQPDDIVSGPATYQYQTGYMYSPTLPQNSMNPIASFVPVFPKNFASNYKILLDDREQDIYAFQFNGRSGQFVIGKNKEPQFILDSKLKITFEEQNMTSSRIRTWISSFTITDEEGIQYKFSELELTELFKYQPSGATVSNFKVFTANVPGSSDVNLIVSKWFLTEIKNPLTNAKITFNYNLYSIDMEGAKQASSQTSQNGSTSKQVLVQKVRMQSKRLSSILLPDNYKVNFNYWSDNRMDLPGDNPLKEINVLYNNSIISGYRFNYGYIVTNEIKPLNFQPQFSWQLRAARLCLTDFRKIGRNGATLPPCTFTYNIPTLASMNYVPHVFTVMTDHWGYYSPNTNSISESSDGYPVGTLQDKNFTFSTLWAQFGILNKIQYPEGGSLEFEYEGNQAENSPYANKYAGGIRVKRVIQYDGVSHTNDIIKHYKYLKADGVSSSAWGFEVARYTDSKVFRQYKVSGSSEIGYNQADLAVNFLKSFVTSQFQAMGAMGASAVLNGNAIGGYEVIIIYILNELLDILFGENFKDYTVSIITNDNMNLANPLPMQYSRVEVIDAIYNSSGVYTGTNGSAVYEFTSDQFVAPRLPASLAAPYSAAQQRYGYWVYGLPQVITWLNASGQPVRKVENFYNPVIREINNNNFVSRSWYVNTQVAAGYTSAFTVTQSSFLNSQSFYPLQGRTELTKSVETFYNSNGGSTNTETLYTYSPENFQVRSVSVKDSKGDISGTTTYYVSDYNIPGSVISNMKMANIMLAPVSMNSWKKFGVDNDRKLIKSVVTEYMQVENGDIRPTQVFSSQLTAPLDNSIANEGNFSPTNFKNYTYLKPLTATSFNQGNPVQQIINSGFSIKSAIYDYNARLKVAEIDNASVSEVRYTSFEADGNGGWSFSPGNIVAEPCPTGTKCYDLSKGSITTGISIQKPLIISAWTKGNQLVVTIPGQLTPARTGPVINGWTYYEFEVADASQISTITISGNGLIDEVRLYPRNARITTFTYDPGIGKTSESDKTGRSIYYEYDDLGRLVQVRDQYRNLIKAYQYNYKQ